MGLFGILGGRRSDEDEQIERQYVSTYVSLLGLQEKEALTLVRRMIADVKADIARYADQPKPLTGDELLTKVQHDQGLNAALEVLRSDGVHDEDIRWWHNLTDLTRGMILQDDIFHHVTFGHAQVANGRTQEEAIRQLPKHFPIYGNPTDESKSRGDNRPLPIELKNRVNAFNVNMAKLDPDGYKERIEHSTSFNALIRNAIRDQQL